MEKHPAARLIPFAKVEVDTPVTLRSAVWSPPAKVEVAVELDWYRDAVMPRYVLVAVFANNLVVDAVPDAERFVVVAFVVVELIMVR